MSKAKDVGKKQPPEKPEESKKPRRQKKELHDMYCGNCGHFMRVQYSIVWGTIHAGPCKNCKSYTDVDITPD